MAPSVIDNPVRGAWAVAGFVITHVVVTFGWYGVFLGPIVLVPLLHFLRRVFPNLLGPDTAAVVTRDR